MLRFEQDHHQITLLGEYIRRARQERQLASDAQTANEAGAHAALATHYELLIELTQRPAAVQAPFDDENSNYTMSTHKLFPFHQTRNLRPALIGR